MLMDGGVCAECHSVLLLAAALHCTALHCTAQSTTRNATAVTSVEQPHKKQQDAITKDLIFAT
jgi:hypothetical protein